MAEAAHVFEWRFEIERSAATPLEGRAVVARFDEEGGLLVHDATQAPTGIRGGLSRLFDIDLEKVHVVAPDVGGGFGVKVIQFYPEEVLVPLAARSLGMPVKWTEDRREHFVGSTHERKQIHHVRVGVREDGRILALETSFVHDSGAYCPYGLIIPIISAAQLPGPYRLDNYRYDFTALFTNMVPTSPYRGAGRPHAAFVMERVMDRVAVELGLDRAEIRRLNFIQPDEFPYDVGVTFQDGGPTVYDSGDYEPGLDKLLEAVGYDGFEARREAARAEGRQDRARDRLLRRGHRHRPVRGRGDQRPGRRDRDGGDRAWPRQGQGHQTMLRPDRRRRARRADRAASASRPATRAGSAGASGRSPAARRWCPATRCRRRRRRCAGRPPSWRRGSSRPTRRTSSSPTARSAWSARPRRRSSIGQLAAMANPLRYAFGEETAEAALYTRRIYATQDVPLPDGTTPGLNATEYYSPKCGRLRLRDARGGRRDRRGDLRRAHPATTSSATTAGASSTRSSSRGRCTAAWRRGSAGRCTSAWPTTRTASC